MQVAKLHSGNRSFSRILRVRAVVPAGLTSALLVAVATTLAASAATSSPLHAQTEQASVTTATVDWPGYGGDPASTRYSPAAQITTANAHELRLAWSVSLGGPANAGAESTPVVADGRLFITTPNQDVFALDPATGRRLWHATPAPGLAGQNRGAAYGDGKVFLATSDMHLIALDARTGKQVWSTQIDPDTTTFYESMAPLYDRGRVIVGVSTGEKEGRGFVTAYDARTGRQDWRFYTTAGPHQVGGKTWPNGDSYLNGGGSVWTTPSVDPALNLIYVDVGNPTPDFLGTPRAGSNLFTDSIVALHADTGRLAWYFQEVHHDLWDLDPSSPPVLLTLPRGNQNIPALIEAGKTGWLYVLDRRNGHPLVPTPERPVPAGPAWQKASPTQPEPRNERFSPRCPAPGLYPREGCIFTPPASKPMLIAPGTLGGSVWSPVSYSARTGLAYIAANDYPSLRSGVASFGEGLGSLPTLPHKGQLIGYDVARGKIAWRAPVHGSAYSGSVVTAGDVVFSGELSGYVDAHDARTGRLLWQYKTAVGADAAPIVFVAGGREYLAIDEGGISFIPPTQSSRLDIFALP